MLFVAALLVFLADRVTKLLVQRSLAPGQHTSIVGDLLWLDNAQNTGIAFSLARSHSDLVLVFAVVAIVAILVYSRRVPAGDTWMRLGLGLVLGGAVGNALDRLLAGSVTDFIDFRVFPVFNVADSGITVGALVVAWRLWLGSRQASGEESPPGA